MPSHKSFFQFVCLFPSLLSCVFWMSLNYPWTYLGHFCNSESLKPLLITREKENWEDRIAKFAKSSSQALLLDDVWKILHLLQQFQTVTDNQESVETFSQLQIVLGNFRPPTPISNTGTWKQWSWILWTLADIYEGFQKFQHSSRTELHMTHITSNSSWVSLKLCLLFYVVSVCQTFYVGAKCHGCDVSIKELSVLWNTQQKFHSRHPCSVLKWCCIWDQRFEVLGGCYLLHSWDLWLQ